MSAIEESEKSSEPVQFEFAKKFQHPPIITVEEILETTPCSEWSKIVAARIELDERERRANQLENRHKELVTLDLLGRVQKNREMASFETWFGLYKLPGFLGRWFRKNLEDAYDLTKQPETATV